MSSATRVKVHPERVVVPLRAVRLRQLDRRNRRVKQVTKVVWEQSRIAYFTRTCGHAAVAKAIRTSFGVTQAEVAAHFGTSSGTVCAWESGRYGWPDGDAELAEYIQAVKQIATSPPA